LPDCFHTSEFLAGQGDFAAWNGKKAKQKEIIKTLVGAVRIRVRRTVTHMVRLEDYRQINEKYAFQECIGFPYSLCARTCVKTLNEWKERYAPEDNFRIVFEDGAKHKGDLVEVMSRDKLPIPSFEEKCALGSLQAADLFAWHVHHIVNKVESGLRMDYSEYYQSFLGFLEIPGQKDHGIYNYERLEELCLRPEPDVPLRSSLSPSTFFVFPSAPNRPRPGKKTERK
jgi:hypothetical protein